MENNLLNGSQNVSVSENGAVMYKTTGAALLDLSWRVPSFRGITPETLDNYLKQLYSAYMEDKSLFAKFLFYLRDVRGGLGERNSFRNFYIWFLMNDRENAIRLLPLIPEYGRWDDLVWLLCNYSFVDLNEVRTDIAKIIAGQLEKDLSGAGNPSLLAKWLPSVNAGKTSRSESIGVIFWLNEVGFECNEESYRKMLSKLRKMLKIVETNIAEKTYGEIDYDAVPSVANTYYAKLFLKYDETRRREYLSKVFQGEKKINAGAVFPHDIYKNVSRSKCEENDAYEAMWKSLPDFVQGNSSTLVVRDGSGSMCCSIPNSTSTAMDVASALCVYFAERLTGEFYNKFITFSSEPELVDFGSMQTLQEKKAFLRRYNDMSSTDVEKVFDLVLNTAVDNKILQEDLPKNILIISDMEFDCCKHSSDANLFEAIAERFAGYGYMLPRLVFWNVNSRTNSIPVTVNKNGVVLVGGYSANICKMVLGGELDPYKALVKVLLSERYSQITVE